jgi:hypothetical protein
MSCARRGLTVRDKAFGRNAETTSSARVTADALDALGRSEEAKALREQYGITGPEKPKPS